MDTPSAPDTWVFEAMSVLSNTPQDRDFDAIYREYHRFVLHTLARHGVSEAARDDAAQEVFIVVHRRWTDRDPRPAKTRSWLYGIARRVAATRRRTLRRRAHYLSRIPSPTPSRDLEQLVDDMRDHRAMVDAIASLEGDKRRVFELVSDEHSGPEIAETLGVPLNTVYSRLRLARGQIVREARRLRERAQAAAQAA